MFFFSFFDKYSVTSEKSINKKIINRHRNYDEVCIDSVPSITDLLNHSYMPLTPSSNKKTFGDGGENYVRVTREETFGDGGEALCTRLRE